MQKIEPAFRESLVDYLRKNHSDICRHWFDDIEPSEIRDGVLRLVVRELKATAISATLLRNPLHRGRAKCEWAAAGGPLRQPGRRREVRPARAISRERFRCFRCSSRR